MLRFQFSSLNLRSFDIEESGRKQQQQKHDENNFKEMFWKSLGAKLLKSWKQFSNTFIKSKKRWTILKNTKRTWKSSATFQEGKCEVRVCFFWLRTRRRTRDRKLDIANKIYTYIITSVLKKKEKQQTTSNTNKN